MQKFQATNNSLQPPRPEEIVETLLVEAGAADQLPTNEAKLLDFLQLEQLSFDFMHELDFLPKTETPIEVRAALSLNDRLIATQSGLSEKQKRFGVFHEVAHFILPEHRDKLFIDTDATLSWWAKARMEREANEIAAELLFQGNRFTEEALNAPTSVRTVIGLAPNYAASYESAMRRYTERHTLPCALIVFSKLPNDTEDAEFEDLEYKIHYTITSAPFRKQFFSAIEIKGGTVKGTDLLRRDKWWGLKDVVESELVVGRPDNQSWHFNTEVFTNGYKIFQFVLPSKESLQV
jgi:Zn-dependent peptidase ImmA (M78 family)